MALVARRRRWAPRLLIALVLVAVAAGAFAIAFRVTLTLTVRGVSGVSNIIDAMSNSAWWWRLTPPMLGALGAGILSLTIAKRGGGGVGDVMEAVALGRARLSLLVTLVNSAASWCPIVCGGSLGREGPLIAFGGTAGETIGARMALSAEDRRVLIAAATAAGFAAAYNTPFAAVVFVLEMVAGIVVVDTVVPTLVATVIAAVAMATRRTVGRFEAIVMLLGYVVFLSLLHSSEPAHVSLADGYNARIGAVREAPWTSDSCSARSNIGNAMPPVTRRMWSCCERTWRTRACRASASGHGRVIAAKLPPRLEDATARPLFTPMADALTTP